ncbi:hypothetical protein ES708_24051 [subsurface metagenome]
MDLLPPWLPKGSQNGNHAPPPGLSQGYGIISAILDKGAGLQELFYR